VVCKPVRVDRAKERAVNSRTMLHPILTLQPVDITNGIIVPILTSIIVGIPLAIYTGLVGSRMTEFKQARTAAAVEVLFMGRKLIEAGDIIRATQGMGEVFAVPMMSLLAQEQKRAAAILAKMQGAMAAELISALRNQIPRRLHDQKIKPEMWVNAVGEVYSTSRTLKEFLNQIERIQPNRWALYEMPTFGRWYSRIVRGKQAQQ
jgi:hypothetical protein